MSMARPSGMQNSYWAPVHIRPSSPTSSTSSLTSTTSFEPSDTVFMPLTSTSTTQRTNETPPSSTRQPQNPLTPQMPLEMIQNVLGYLAPLDFNAARRICGEWMNASQDSTILQKMLIRGGWWTTFATELGPEANNLTSLDPSYLSRRLARECSQLPNWTGNGVSLPGTSRVTESVQSHRVFTSPTRFAGLPEQPADNIVLSGGFSFDLTTNNCASYSVLSESWVLRSGPTGEIGYLEAAVPSAFTDLEEHDLEAIPCSSFDRDGDVEMKEEDMTNWSTDEDGDIFMDRVPFSLDGADDSSDDDDLDSCPDLLYSSPY